MKNFYQKVTAILASPKFFYGVVVALVLEASWIAVSSHYPMAFDENFHLGVIRLYSHHFSPWWNQQPAGADIYGAIYRDPSYLYHWLMSFPYRLISLFLHGDTSQAIALRLINVGLFAGGLVAWRKLLTRATTSPALVNLSLLFLILVPVIPSLAGQINYDNLLFGLVPSSVLLGLNFLKSLEQRLDLKKAGSLIILCLLTSLVKYAFLPIFLVIVLFIVAALFKTYLGKQRRLFGHDLNTGLKQLSTWAKLGLIIGLVGSGGLFFERYGLNTLRYDTPLPECNQVLSQSQCLNYGPWARNYRIQLSRGQPGSGTVHFNIVTFSQHWLFVLYRSMFYVLNGPDSAYSVGEPLLLPAVVAVVVLVGGLYALIRYWRQLFKLNPTRLLLVSLVAAYAGILWLQNYADYRHLGQPVALQGRYLIPVLAPLIFLLGLGLKQALTKHHQAQAMLAVITVLLFLQGGGVVTFLIRTDNGWYITNSVTAQLNNDLRPVAQHLVVGK